MSIKDAWTGSSAVRWLLTFLGAALVAAASGFWTMSAQVNHLSGQVEAFMSAAAEVHRTQAERIRYLERARRGLPPGEP